jgi:hypothetical protein
MADFAWDRMKTAMAAIVRALVGNTLIGPRVDWLAKYDARVVAQNADGTLELKPDDDRLPSYSSVPIRYGVPGITATVATGARVVLEFSGANPQRPIATVWESAAVMQLNINAATSITLNGGVLPVARVGDTAGPYPIVGGNPTVKA